MDFFGLYHIGIHVQPTHHSLINCLATYCLSDAFARAADVDDDILLYFNLSVFSFHIFFDDF